MKPEFDKERVITITEGQLNKIVCGSLKSSEDAHGYIKLESARKRIIEQVRASYLENEMSADTKQKTCWLFHKWTTWGDPEPGTTQFFNWPPESCMVQERRCTRCNKRELRRAA